MPRGTPPRPPQLRTSRGRRAPLLPPAPGARPCARTGPRCLPPAARRRSRPSPRPCETSRPRVRATPPVPSRAWHLGRAHSPTGAFSAKDSMLRGLARRMPRNPSACDVRRALRTGRSCARVPWGHCAAGLRGRPAHRSLWPRSPRAPFAPIRRAPPPSRLRLHRPFVRVCVRGLPPSPFRRRAALRAAPPFGEAPRGRGSSRSWRRRAP